eukprot:1194472-Prorocentrum_minimum.AAC.3
MACISNRHLRRHACLSTRPSSDWSSPRVYPLVTPPIGRSLEGLLAIDHTIAVRCAGGAGVAEEAPYELAEYYNFWEERMPEGGEAVRAQWLRKRKQIKRKVARPPSAGPVPRAGLGLVQGTSTLHTEFAPGNPGCSQCCRVLRLTGV